MIGNYNRRQFLIALACASAYSLPFGGVPGRRWVPSEVDWDEVINDVLCDTSSVIGGYSDGMPNYEIGSPHWCVERAMDNEGY
jgi:hypothetical protein